jgi:peptide deformylase
MILPIVKEPNPILHQKAIPVTQMTAEIKKLIADMIETMHAAPGVGLAASQVGSRLNILVASVDGEKGKELVLLNSVVKQQKGKALCPEGCLSVPGVSSKVHRATEVVVEGLAPTMEPVVVEAEGLMAQILQHETDHLQGHLYVERLSFWKKKRLLKKYQESVV